MGANTATAIAVLKSIAEDKNEDASARIRAAESLSVIPDELETQGEK